MNELVCNEINIMNSITHPYIVNLLNYSLSDSLIKPNGDSKEVYYLSLELAPGGELFDFLAETGEFSEEMTRYYFRQLLDAFAYLNENGISHRDLKPENIMFDQDYNIKITDFGFSSSKPLNFSKKGTLNYMAPEVLEGCAYTGHYADLFSLAIIAFLILSKHPPFLRAQTSDQYYRLLLGNRDDLFWTIHSKNKPEGFYSESFKDLMNWMFSYNPMQRPSISEIMAHEWYNGPVPTQDEVKDIIEAKKASSIKANYQPDAISPSSSPSVTTSGSTIWRSEGDENIERKVSKYYSELKRLTQFFSTYEPDILFNALALFAEKCQESKFYTEDYSAKLKFGKEEEPDLEVRVNILEVSDKSPKYCVEFIRESGDCFEFNETYRNIRDFFGGLVNAKE